MEYVVQVDEINGHFENDDILNYKIQLFGNSDD